jgi:outer membrane protein assembly factor BamB
MNRITFFVLAAWLVAVADGQAADWNQFRGPTADGRAGSPGLPRSWTETENVRWKTPLPGKAWASPVAADGRIWLANATEDGKRLSTVCVDAETGRILHDVTLFEIAEPAFCHPYNSPASPTPVLAGGKVFIHFGSAGTACLDAATATIAARARRRSPGATGCSSTSTATTSSTSWRSTRPPARRSGRPPATSPTARTTAT